MSLLGITGWEEQADLSSGTLLAGLRRFARFRPGPRFYTCLAGSIVLFLGGLLGQFHWQHITGAVQSVLSLMIVLGAAGLCVAALLAEGKMLIGDWIDNTAVTLAEAFYARDHRGRSVPRAGLLKWLNQQAAWQTLCWNQPTRTLLALMSSQHLVGSRTAILECLNATSVDEALGKYPNSTVLTNIAFALNHDDRVRNVAERQLPRLLWPHAIKTLLRAKHADTRIAAVQRANIPHQWLLGACVADAASEVRETAWQCLGEVTPKDTASLLHSTYADTRVRAVQSRRVSRNQLLALSTYDAAPAVRREAWQQLRTRHLRELSSQDVAVLWRSPYADTRTRVVQSNECNRPLLIKACKDDSSPAVRREAWQCLTLLSPQEVARLLKSFHADTRIRLIQAKVLSPKTLAHLCRTDTSLWGRQQALQCIPNDHTATHAVDRYRPVVQQRLRDLSGPYYKRTKQKAILRLMADMPLEELEILFNPSGQYRVRDEVRKLLLDHLVARGDTAASKMLLQYLSDAPARDQEAVVAAILCLIGSAAIQDIVSQLGLLRTFQIASEEWLVEYYAAIFNKAIPQEAAEILLRFEKQSLQVTVGTVTSEVESYDNYGSRYTYTQASDHRINITYFQPAVIAKMIRIMKAVEERQRNSILSVVAAQNEELPRLIQLGLEYRDWQTEIYEPVLREARAVAVNNFSARSDSAIISQLI